MKYSFSSIAVTTLISVVQAAPSLRIADGDKSIQGDSVALGLRIVGGDESAQGDFPYFGKQTTTFLLLSPSFRSEEMH